MTNDGLGEPAKLHKLTVAIRTHRDFPPLREAHPSETAAEVLAVAGDFGRAADLFFSAPLRSFPFWLRLCRAGPLRLNPIPVSRLSSLVRPAIKPGAML
jgi:hypothetical protein